MNINAVFLDKKIKHLLGIDLFFQLKEIRFFYIYIFFISVRRYLTFMTHRIDFPRCQYVRSAKNLENILKRLAKCREIVSTTVWRVCQFMIATLDDTTFPLSLPRCAPRLDNTPLHEASLMRHRYLWGYLHIAKHIEPRQMAAGTRETPEYSSR